MRERLLRFTGVVVNVVFSGWSRRNTKNHGRLQASGISHFTRYEWSNEVDDDT